MFVTKSATGRIGCAQCLDRDDSERSQLMMRAVYGWPRALLIQLLAVVSAVPLPLLSLTPSAHAQAGSTPPALSTPAPAQSVTYPPPAAAAVVTPAPAESTSTALSSAPEATAAVGGGPAPATATAPADVGGADESPNEGGKLDWDRAHRRYSSWYGPTGGLFLFDG